MKIKKLSLEKKEKTYSTFKNIEMNSIKGGVSKLDTYKFTVELYTEKMRIDYYFN